MAATRFNVQSLPKNSLAGFWHQFRVTAINADGTTDTGFVGTVSFASTDPSATLPANYTFVGGDSGTHLFRVRFYSFGAQTLTVTSGALTAFTCRTTVLARPVGRGLEDEALLPYGDAASGAAVHLVSAAAVSTKEVDVTVSNYVKDSSPYLAGDALNPATWTVQRLDSAAFFHVVSVVQVDTFTYRLLCLEPFGDASVTHTLGSTTLLDVSGALLVAPKAANFLGCVEAGLEAALMGKRVTRDVANRQVPVEGQGFIAGTLQLSAQGDYQLESGSALVRKLLYRRLMSTQGDFFHLPSYGLGLSLKGPARSAQLAQVKTAVEQECRKEREVAEVSTSVLLDPKTGTLTIRTSAKLATSGEDVEVSFKTGPNGTSVV